MKLLSRSGIETTLAAACVLVSACAGHPPDASPVDAQPAPSSDETKSRVSRPTDLSREMAWLRARQVGQISYILWFGLDADHDDFEGRIVVNFELKDLKKVLAGLESIKDGKLRRRIRDLASTISLDFEKGKISSLTVNGGSADPAKHYDGHRIRFNTSELLPTGLNRVEISFTHAYSRDGEGFHRFQDPVDKRVYLYTDLEPYSAHRVFPCFDQPDLKASYELTVESPEEWQVIANTMQRDISKVDGRRSWAFPPSPIFSTYVFALHAGPYASWKAGAHGVPIRLFVRQSLKRYVNPADWFDVTKKGLEYFNTEFGYPYPYAKYDQVIVPEYNHGAMENVAAVTFSERFVPRSRMTMDNRRDLAGTILHEMAHMWFGDLVTMHWWNGIWLNESFATFMASKAMAEATDFQGVWQDFFGMKAWAYWTDQLVTSHPVEVPVPDTDFAKTNFDGITYGKGAAILKQLNYYLSPDDFREGLQRYFMRYALRNTTTHDFIRVLSEASGKDLAKWQRAWLLTPGVNGLRADWACDADGKISKFDLIQTPPETGKELRPHRTQVGLFGYGGNGQLELRRRDLIAVAYSDAKTPVPEAIGKTCPGFVFPNYEDWDYVKVELDPVSLEIAAKSVGKVEDPLLRRMLWQTLWQMVRDGRMAAQDFADTVLAQGGGERDTQVLGANLRNLAQNEVAMPSVLKYLSGRQRAEYWSRIDAWTLRHLERAPAGSDSQRVWFDAFLRAAVSPKSSQFARHLLDGSAKLPEFEVGQVERWQLIGLLAENGASDARALIDSELKNDPTDLGQRLAAAAEASIPDPANKEKWFANLLAPIENGDQSALPQAQLRAAADRYFSLRHEDEIRGEVDAYFSAIPKLVRRSESPYSGVFEGRLYPSLCDPAIVEKTTAVLNAHPDLPAEVIKGLKIQRQEEERCIRARAKSSAGVKTASQ